jgi:hypothetical protein
MIIISDDFKDIRKKEKKRKKVRHPLLNLTGKLVNARLIIHETVSQVLAKKTQKIHEPISQALAKKIQR